MFGIFGAFGAFSATMIMWRKDINIDVTCHMTHAAAPHESILLYFQSFGGFFSMFKDEWMWIVWLRPFAALIIHYFIYYSSAQVEFVTFLCGCGINSRRIDCIKSECEWNAANCIYIFTFIYLLSNEKCGIILPNYINYEFNENDV